MFNKKNIILIAIILLVPILLMGCATSIKEEISTKASEKIVEKITGNKIKIDSKDETLSLEMEDGSTQIGENLEWPVDMDPLPNPGGNISSISYLEDGNYIHISVESYTLEEAKEYIKKINDLGYKEDSFQDNVDSILYEGFKEDNTRINISYFEMFNILQINMEEDSEQAKKFFEDN